MTNGFCLEKIMSEKQILASGEIDLTIHLPFQAIYKMLRAVNIDEP